MKILFVQSLAYIPSFGGANKANRVLIEGLALRGHDCRVVAAATPDVYPQAQEQLREELRARGISVTASSAGKLVFHHKGVEVHAAVNGFQLRSEMKSQIREFEPGFTLVSCEDPAQTLLEGALEMNSSRVVSIVQTPLALPFGPASFLVSPARTALFKQTAGVITICHYLKNYMLQWGALNSEVILPPVFGDGPFPSYKNFDTGLVTIINPSAIKGLSIFLALARALPAVNFGAVPTWATTNADLANLGQLPNVRILKPADEIDEILSQTRVLLVPSLWGEGFGYVIVEAMLRGIPVLASDVGGAPEAKLGVDYVLPVNPITRYEERLDDRRLPVPITPEQNIEPWYQALQELLSDRAHYEKLADASREAALSFVSKLGIGHFEEFLKNLVPASTTPGDHIEPSPAIKEVSLLNQLSPERRALLALKLKAKRENS
jgi:glycosyltransferase involved in cell wall biosynthesis